MDFIKRILPVLLLCLFENLYAQDLHNVSLTDESEVEVRVFPGNGKQLLLGFACDEGISKAAEETAKVLSEDGVEVWMPDLLSAYMLPNVKSSLKEIPTESLVDLIEKAHQKTGKDVYLIAGGPETELLLRSAQAWEKKYGTKQTTKPSLKGAILLFPRLMDKKPVPGEEPVYVRAVGSTKLPLILLEGERTPNRWGTPHLANALGTNGSKVQTKLIPSVRGYFFERQDANAPEELVTSQLSGLIKASLYSLNH